MTLLNRLRMDVTPYRQSRDFRLLFLAGTVFYLGGMVTYVAIPYPALRHHRLELRRRRGRPGRAGPAHRLRPLGRRAGRPHGPAHPAGVDGRRPGGVHRRPRRQRVPCRTAGLAHLRGRGLPLRRPVAAASVARGADPSDRRPRPAPGGGRPVHGGDPGRHAGRPGGRRRAAARGRHRLVLPRRRRRHRDRDGALLPDAPVPTRWRTPPRPACAGSAKGSGMRSVAGTCSAPTSSTSSRCSWRCPPCSSPRSRRTCCSDRRCSDCSTPQGPSVRSSLRSPPDGPDACTITAARWSSLRWPGARRSRSPACSTTPGWSCCASPSPVPWTTSVASSAASSGTRPSRTRCVAGWPGSRCCRTRSAPSVGRSGQGWSPTEFGVRQAITSGGILCVLGVAATSVWLRGFWTYDDRTDPYAVHERKVRAERAEQQG